MLREGDIVVIKVSCLQVLSRLVLQKNPWEKTVFVEHEVKLGIVEENSIVDAGVEVEGCTVDDSTVVCQDLVRIPEAEWSTSMSRLYPRIC